MTTWRTIELDKSHTACRLEVRASLTVGAFAKRHHEVMFTMVILARHQAKEPETLDVGDNVRIFTCHLQCHIVVGLVGRDDPATIHC